MAAKLMRQNLIKELLNNRIISSQEQLIKLLERKNIEVTQATLSRDFADMGVAKTFYDGKIRYVLNSEESGRQLSRIIGLEILSVTANESTIIIRTLAGRAQGVAHFIDRLNKEEILGTIGGDDTVVVIPHSVKEITQTIEVIKDLLICYPN